MPAPVVFTPAGLPGLVVAEPKVFGDARGFFTETWSEPVWRAQGYGMRFVQDNLSRSSVGVLRGLHYQIAPHAMGKLVRCVHGAIFDVAVDLRRGSPTFAQWFGIALSAQNQKSLWIPEGFAHGFLALEEGTLVHYKCTAAHAPECERSLSWRCPQVGIQWPMAPRSLSEKDEAAPMLDAAEFDFEYAPGA